jgi:23S rRNA (adenine2503-C2)-methyltransferase
VRVLKTIEVPTGHILIVQGDHGPLELLSIGDYGKDVNLKADFMGLNRVLTPVRHTKLLPLEEKWVITVSTQYGCDSGCTFCDVPKVGRGINATVNDIVGQVDTALALHPEVTQTDRLNIHFARMGEPTWNPHVLEAAKILCSSLLPHVVHPVVSTMCPRANDWLQHFLWEWVKIKKRLAKTHMMDAGLQFSINSTSEAERDKMFRGSALTLKEISCLMYGMVQTGRKFTLNFALGGWEINPKVLLKYFSPDDYLCKLTPLHRTKVVNSKGLMPSGDWTEYTPYQETEAVLKKAGYDVIVFVASKEEDESRITCGNAILADKQKGNQ